VGRIHFVGGEKGGVGRSLFAKLLAQLWIDQAIRWTGFDTDRSHGTLRRSYSDFVRPIEVERAADLDLTVEALEEGVDEVLVDLAGQSEASLARWLESGQVLDFMRQLQHEVWFWYVIDDTWDSVLLLGSFLDRFAGAARIVCVVNHGRGHDFSLFEDSKLRNRIEQAHGIVLELPELHRESMLKMDAYDKSFWAAVHNTDPGLGPCLTLMQRQRAKVFIRTVQASLRELLFDQPPQTP